MSIEEMADIQLPREPDAPMEIGLVGNGLGGWTLWNRHDNDPHEAVRYVRADVTAALQAEIESMAPIDAMGARELARAAGVSPTTATRAKRGDVLSYGNMRKLLPFMNTCPCCKKKMSDADRELVLASLNRKN
jgi:hypothetical protein